MTIHHAPDAMISGDVARSTGAVGATSELIACAELMRLGYFVYRCESPSAPFDLVAYRDGRCLRVEVKTISMTKYAPSYTHPVNDEWDLLAVVGQGADVFLFEAGTPGLEIRNALRLHFGYPALPETKALQPCGTPAAYHRHRARRQAPCDPCREAMRKAAKRPLTAERAELVPVPTPETLEA